MRRHAHSEFLRGIPRASSFICCAVPVPITSVSMMCRIRCGNRYITLPTAAATLRHNCIISSNCVKVID